MLPRIKRLKSNLPKGRQKGASLFLQLKMKNRPRRRHSKRQKCKSRRVRGQTLAVMLECPFGPK